MNQEQTNEPLHFYDRRVPVLLQELLAEAPEQFALADLGCGDGHFVFALRENQLLDMAGWVCGIDVSPARIHTFKSLTGFPGVIADGERVTSLADNSFDIVISTMVIEHVADDGRFIDEVYRLLKPGGKAYVTTVVKQPWAWYFRKNANGETVLDSTHRREYGSLAAFAGLFDSQKWRIQQSALHSLRPPIIHPILRLVHQRLPQLSVHRLCADHALFRFLEKLVIPMPGYQVAELVACKTMQPETASQQAHERPLDG